jgi:hypothetical protein
MKLELLFLDALLLLAFGLWVQLALDDPLVPHCHHVHLLSILSIQVDRLSAL